MLQAEVPVRLVFTLAALLVAHQVAAGTITGKVTLTEKGGRTAPDVSDVIVYVDGVKARPRPATETVTMRSKQFRPHVVVVPVGGTVQFPNEDSIFHNVFSVSGENRFDLALYKKPKTGSWTFQHPGVAKVYCNIHPQMSAVVVVRDNPYFARASADGSFVIEGVPAGQYTLKAYHERAAETAVPVTVTDKGDTRADLALDASGFKRVQHKNKFGKAYDRGDRY